MPLRLESPRHLVRLGARRHGERPAAVFAEGHMTYRELAARTAALAEGLRESGVGPGSQVAIVLPNSASYLVWYFGVLEAGGIVAPLAPGITPAEANRVLDIGGIGFVVAPPDSRLERELGFLHTGGPATDPGACLFRTSGQVRTLETQPWTPRGIMAQQFSSGSTGKPKAMLKAEGHFAHDAWHFCETLKLRGAETFLGVSPFHHSYGGLSILAAFAIGGCVSVLPRFLPGPVLEAARRDQPAVFLATPPMLEILGSCFLAPGDERAFEGLKACICSTGRLRKPVYEAFRARFGVPVRVQYGSTETLSATVDLEDGFEEGRVGRPYAEVEVGVFDEQDRPCPAGRPGSVGVRSPAACAEYVGDPHATARTFRNGYAFPGDRGYLDDSGVLHVMGRADVINVGGDKVDPLEVEATIRDSLPVVDVVVLEGTRAGLPTLRVIAEADPAQVTGAMIMALCRERLSRHKVPAHVEVRKRLPRDENGKVIGALLEP